MICLTGVANMDWRQSNVACLFNKEQTRPLQTGGYTRYTRSEKTPFVYGLCARDYDSDHKPREWPPDTEYQYAYCSNYRSLTLPLMDVGVELPANRSWETGSRESAFSQHFQKLYNVTPLPIIDKHYRGAKYKVHSHLGVIVPEELTRRRETLHGPIRLSCQSDQENVYTVNYLYKEWVSRPTIELDRDMGNNRLSCRLPETPSQFWDFYNVVRMHRPAKTLKAEPMFMPCETMPLPSSRNMPDVPPVSTNPQLGKFNKFFTSEKTVGSSDTSYQH